MATAEEVDRPDSEDEDYPDSDIRCPVCLDLYTEPKILPCGHLACKQCLLNWLKANVHPTTCPTCRGDITEEELCKLPSTMTPEEICAALPTELGMECHVDAYKQLQPPHVCGRCGEEANSFCLDCYGKLCRKCRKKHTKVTAKKASRAAASREATLSSEAGAAAVPEDAEADGAPPNLPYVAPTKHRVEMLASLKRINLVSDRGEPLCEKHADDFQVQDYWCETHDHSLCRRCMEESHARCVLVTAKAKVAESQQKLAEMKKKLDRHQDLLRQEEENLTRKEKEAQIISRAVKEQVGSVMDGVLQRLKDTQDKLTRDLSDTQNLPPAEAASQQVALLNAFKESLPSIVSIDRAERAVQSYLTYSEETQKNIRERADALTGRNRLPSAAPQRVRHHHRGHQQRHGPDGQPRGSNSPHASPESQVLQSVHNDILGAVQEASDGLQMTMLSLATPRGDTTPATVQGDNLEADS